MVVVDQRSRRKYGHSPDEADDEVEPSSPMTFLLLHCMRGFSRKAMFCGTATTAAVSVSSAVQQEKERPQLGK